MTAANLIDGLAAALEEAAHVFDRGTDWPAALLWPDPDNQFAPVFAAMRADLSGRDIALFRLGGYDPAAGIGPAIWLRCLIDAKVDASPEPGMLPVFLLPGVSSAELKRPQTLPKLIQPLAELQFRGDIFRNRRQARDWTVGPFLRSPEQGLGLDMASDARTDDAAAAALPQLLAYPLSDLPARRLTAEDFTKLIVSDHVGALLAFIGDPGAARAERPGPDWDGAVSLVRQNFKIDMNVSGARQEATKKLNDGRGAWKPVLARVDESPEQYRAVVEELRKLEGLGQLAMPGFEEAKAGTSAHNQREEERLAGDLERVAELAHSAAIGRVMKLEDEHGKRRKSRWGRLGEAPLAGALEPLARLGAEVRGSLSGSDVPALAEAYADGGWQADAALIDALAAAGQYGAVVGRVARALYLPWAEPLANRFREALALGGSVAAAKPLKVRPGTMVLFVDGLRLDLGRRLFERLHAAEPATFAWRLAPVPTVTATAKPLVTPVAEQIKGAGSAEQFLPLETSSGRPADTRTLVAAMKARGVDVMEKGAVLPPCSPEAIGWSEVGHLDKDGHAMGERLAGQVETEIETVAVRVQAFRKAGWARVRIVTDHGWLLIPGGLPKAEIAASTVATKWSRVAKLTEGSAPEAFALPWAHDSAVRIAVPPGVHAFKAGESYAHGGVSLQECVVPDILVGETTETFGAASAGATASLKIVALAWSRYKLTATLTREAPNHEIVVRRKHDDATSRVETVAYKQVGERIDIRLDGDLDEELEVAVVLLDAHGSVVDFRATAIGVN